LCVYGLRIQNRVAEKTADSLIYANIHANRALGLSSSWEFNNINAVKKGKLQQDEALRDYYRWSSKEKQKDVDAYSLRNTLDYGTRIFTGAGNTVGTLKRSFPDKPSPVKGFR
jgi:PIN domain nuclease of toxin-antitoxin system